MPFFKAGENPSDLTDCNYQNNLAYVLYMPDRAPEVDKDENLTYGVERSSLLVFDHAQFRIGRKGLFLANHG